MARCAAEQCLNWTGQGCICEVMDLEPETTGEEDDEGLEWRDV